MGEFQGEIHCWPQNNPQSILSHLPRSSWWSSKVFYGLTGQKLNFLDSRCLLPQMLHLGFRIWTTSCDQCSCEVRSYLRLLTVHTFKITNKCLVFFVVCVFNTHLSCVSPDMSNLNLQAAPALDLAAPTSLYSSRQMQETRGDRWGAIAASYVHADVPSYSMDILLLLLLSGFKHYVCVFVYVYVLHASS